MAVYIFTTYDRKCIQKFSINVQLAFVLSWVHFIILRMETIDINRRIYIYVEHENITNWVNGYNCNLSPRGGQIQPGFQCHIKTWFLGQSTAYVSNDLLIIVSAVYTYALRKFWIEDGINNVTRVILGYAEVSIYIILKSSSCTYSGNTDSFAMLEQFWIKATYFPLA